MSITLDAYTLRQSVPYESPFVLLDRVEAYVPHERQLTAIKNLSQSEPFLRGHFPDYPIFPGVMIIEALAQACRVLMNLDHLSEQGLAPPALKEALLQQDAPRGFLVESAVKHSEGVYPGDQLQLRVQISAQQGDLYTFKASARVGPKEVGRGRIVLLRSDCESLPS